MNQLPEQFIERLKQVFPDEQFTSILNTFSLKKRILIRVNSLKTNHRNVRESFKKLGISYQPLSWYQDGLLLENIEQEQFRDLDLVKQGYIYQQGASSMLVPVILDPQPSDDILDLCAAPGSKTSQMAAMMDNKGSILAVEAIRTRFYRLKSVLALLGVENTHIKMMDGRRLRLDGLPYDKILVDAPCSSEGRFRLDNPKTFAFWNVRKIKEMVKKQRGLLQNAVRLLKPGGVLIYSTCTFSPEENEGVIDWILRKNEHLEVLPIDVKGIKTYPCLTQWSNKTYNQKVEKAVRIFPDENMDGFFIAKLWIPS